MTAIFARRSGNSKLRGSRSSWRVIAGMFRARRRRLVCTGKVCRKNCASWVSGGRGESQWRTKHERRRGVGSRVRSCGRRELAIWHGQSARGAARANDVAADGELACDCRSFCEGRFTHREAECRRSRNDSRSLAGRGSARRNSDGIARCKKRRRERFVELDCELRYADADGGLAELSRTARDEKRSRGGGAKKRARMGAALRLLENGRGGTCVAEF